ncbi:MAG: pirin family protein [Deltaproteobacteria bacterium]|jgi:redox-sensitive bicupin YhaK (pirin superfamily)|nr:pirin family protein [Deltaproteobacteria bacterium]
MELRKVKKTVQGHHTVDGAGVHLVRVLGISTVYDYDPFLMLDSFDSENPEDYIKGFPFHPHRGIETITYLIEGKIEHQDSLGNKGVIQSGQSQWMTAGSGIMHQEMPAAVPKLLGVQIWLNLPKKQKMAEPTYFDITGEDIVCVDKPYGKVKVLSGNFDTAKGVKPPHIEATIIDFLLNPGQSVTIPTNKGENCFIFTIVGPAYSQGELYPAKTAVLFEMEGDAIEVTAPKETASRFIFFEGKPLGESISWGGPIVMNTDEELREAFVELETGKFIKHKAGHYK